MAFFLQGIVLDCLAMPLFPGEQRFLRITRQKWIRLLWKKWVTTWLTFQIFTIKLFSWICKILLNSSTFNMMNVYENHDYYELTYYLFVLLFIYLSLFNPCLKIVKWICSCVKENFSLLSCTPHSYYKSESNLIWYYQQLCCIRNRCL